MAYRPAILSPLSASLVSSSWWRLRPAISPRAAQCGSTPSLLCATPEPLSKAASVLSGLHQSSVMTEPRAHLREYGASEGATGGRRRWPGFHQIETCCSLSASAGEHKIDDT